MKTSIATLPPTAHCSIIRIEKAPKPVVRDCYIVIRNGGLELWHIAPRRFECEDAYKITITDGEATIERVK